MKKIVYLLISLFSFNALHAQDTGITAAEAKKYVGKTINICDVIKEARLDNVSKDEATVLYTGDSYDNRTLALVFTKRVLHGFKYNPADKMINHKFCVHGKVIMYKGKPGIYIKSESQLNVAE